MTQTLDADIIVRHNRESHTYEALLGDELVGLVVYEPAGASRLALTHAAVEEHHRKLGIGTRLVTETLDDIRRSGLRITVYCQVVVDFLAKHPEYTDLVDPQVPGRVARPDGGAQSVEAEA
jgi:predicted GNAT family acetyltransferase